MIGNIAGKGENAGNQHFLLFPQCFQKFFPQGYHHYVIKGQMCLRWKLLVLHSVEDKVGKVKNSTSFKINLYFIDTHFYASATGSF